MTQEIQYTSKVYKTHNGKVTIENPATGNHRTFEISTQPQISKFAPGKRVVGLLYGPDNESMYYGFGFANETGVAVWKKDRGGVYDTYAKMLSNPESFQKRGLVYHFEGTCRRCNRTLTHPESIQSGIGPICASKE